MNKKNLKSKLIHKIISNWVLLEPDNLDSNACCEEVFKNIKSIQLKDGYEYKKKVSNKFVMRKQSNERERCKVLRVLAMCLRP